MGSSDVFTISALLVLIMGAACFYLYTRIKQAEKKLALVEGILLDLKTATEASFMDFPAATSYLLAKDLGAEDDEEEPFIPESTDESPVAFQDDDDEVEDLEPVHEEIPTPVQVNKVEETLPAEAVTPDLELLNVKELMAIARSKGLTISKTMRKQQIIDAINSASSVVPVVEESTSSVDGVIAESEFISGTSLDSAPF
jgi:hypothetical protein